MPIKTLNMKANGRIDKNDMEFIPQGTYVVRKSKDEDDDVKFNWAPSLGGETIASSNFWIEDGTKHEDSKLSCARDTLTNTSATVTLSGDPGDGTTVVYHEITTSAGRKMREFIRVRKEE